MKKENQYIFGLTFLLVAVVLALIFAFNSLGSDTDKINNLGEENTSFPELFRERAIQKLGVIPIEGFDPDMYKGTFKGLVDEDFNNVEAIGGRWIIQDNKLTFARDSSQGITSADGTLNDEGVLALIDHLETRFNMEVKSEEDLDDLIVLISN